VRAANIAIAPIVSITKSKRKTNSSLDFFLDFGAPSAGFVIGSASTSFSTSFSEVDSDFGAVEYPVGFGNDATVGDSSAIVSEALLIGSVDSCEILFSVPVDFFSSELVSLFGSGEVIETWQCGHGPVVAGRLMGITIRPSQLGHWKER